MLLESIVRKHLLLERKIKEIRANLTITYSLQYDGSGHADKRKWRHATSEGGKIYDYDITNLIEQSKDEITFHIVQDQIVSGVRFIVSERKQPFLNVVISPKMMNPYMWNLDIITVMKKEDFNIGIGQLQIFV